MATLFEAGARTISTPLPVRLAAVATRVDLALARPGLAVLVLARRWNPSPRVRIVLSDPELLREQLDPATGRWTRSGWPADPDGTLIAARRLLDLGCVQVRVSAGPDPDWYPDFSLYSSPDGTRALIGDHTWPRTRRGPRWATLADGGDADHARERFVSLWSASVDVTGPVHGWVVRAARHARDRLRAERARSRARREAHGASGEPRSPLPIVVDTPRGPG